MRSADTSPDAHARHLAVYRSMSPARRGEIAAAMSDEVMQVAAEGIRRRHADYDDDTVLAKLEWAAMGGSDRQLVDAASVLAVVGEAIDDGYLDRWAAELGVTDLLAKVRPG